MSVCECGGAPVDSHEHSCVIVNVCGQAGTWSPGVGTGMWFVLISISEAFHEIWAFSGGPALPTPFSGEVGPQPASLWLEPRVLLEPPCRDLWFLSSALFPWQ